MTKKVRFNYIITIYNKEDLIREVLLNVIQCCGENSCIYPVLDGCTDKSEEIIDEIIKDHSDISIKKVFTNDVHELLSINAGLKVASHEGDGYNIILQDDVIIEDHQIEDKVEKLYELEGDKLGYVSFRLGANLTKDALTSRKAVPYTDYVENAYGYGLLEAEMLPIGSIAYRTVPIKSPVCIPFKIVRTVGMYNECLAPYGHDDIDLALRTINAGYYNAVFSIQFASEVEWGGTRQEGHTVVDSIIEKNMDFIRDLYPKEIEAVCNSEQPKSIKRIEQLITISEDECQKVWKAKVKRYTLYQKTIQFLRPHLKPLYYKYSVIKRRVNKKKDVMHFAKLNPKYDKEFSFTESIAHYKTRNEVHQYYHHYYNHRLPKIIKDHRLYIENHQKGFGEPAFHAMWWKLILEFKPVNVLEIGVYRGQVVSLWTLIGELLLCEMNVHGISPFSSFGDSVSEYLSNLDYYEDAMQTFKDLSLKQPTFVKGFSNDKQAVDHIRSKTWDMMYIDGGHDYKDVLFDYELCLENVRAGGLIIFDDASLYTDYKPVAFSFAGHPGPSRVARDFADKEMEFIGAVGHNNIYRKI